MNRPLLDPRTPEALREQLTRDRQAVLAWIDACRAGGGDDEAARRVRRIDWNS